MVLLEVHKYVLSAVVDPDLVMSGLSSQSHAMPTDGLRSPEAIQHANIEH